MAYTRWSSGDLYIFHHCGGFYVCMCCPMLYRSPKKGSADWYTKDLQRMIKHVRHHRKKGHTFHPQCIEFMYHDKRELRKRGRRKKLPRSKWYVIDDTCEMW